MNASARAILDAKLALEAEIARPILTLCTRYIETWVLAQGRMPIFDRVMVLNQLEKALLRHYARTVMVMTGRRPPKDPPLHIAVRTLRHMDSLRARAKQQAQLILRSVDRELGAQMQGRDSPSHPFDGTTNYPPFGKGGLDVVEFKAGVRGVRAGYIGKLKAAAVSTIAKLKAKISTIANVNTQSVSEEARDAEIEIVPQNQANGHIEKTWNSLMDGRERPAHHEAHGQTVPVTENFDVGGEELRFPGDASLGASLGNLCNCRCFLTHTWVSNEDDSRTLIHVGPSAPTRRYQPLGPGKPSVMVPTSVATLNGNTTARIVLGDGNTFATLRQPTPSTIEVLVNRRVVGRAAILNGRAVNVNIDPGMPANYDIDGLIQRSVEHSAQR